MTDNFIQFHPYKNALFRSKTLSLFPLKFLPVVSEP